MMQYLEINLSPAKEGNTMKLSGKCNVMMKYEKRDLLSLKKNKLMLNRQLIIYNQLVLKRMKK
jgi:hypothetical protein